MESFGTRLKRLRDELRLTQDELAKLIGVSQLTVSNYETSKRFPDIRIFDNLVKESNVNLNWLITGNGSMFNTLISNDPDKVDLFFCYDNIKLVRRAVLSTLEEIRTKYPELFNNIQKTYDPETSINKEVIEK